MAKPKFPVNVSAATYALLGEFADARGLNRREAADKLIAVGANHVAAAARRHRSRVSKRSVPPPQT